MAKRVLDVGQCDFDHGAIRGLLSQEFGADVIRAHDWEDVLKTLQQATCDLVLVNRMLDQGGASGLEIIRKLKADDVLKHLPVMLVTNYPEYQQQAQALGAVPGFGKAELRQPATIELLKEYLGN